jgi:hypothetical protein
MALTDNIRAYWKFNEHDGTSNAKDSAGSNDLQNFNGVGYDTGVVNDCAKSYAPDNSYFRMAGLDGSKMHMGTAFSFAGWFKFNNLLPAGNSIEFVGKHGIGQTEYYFDLVTESLGFSHLHLVISDDGDPSHIDQYSTTSLALGNGHWWHIGVTWDGTGITKTATFYVNGVVDGTATGTRSLYAASTYLFEVHPVCTIYAYTDELGAWDRVLSQNEIIQLYNNGNGFTYPFIQPNTNLIAMF